MGKVFKATFVIIGTVIGAGFASGQEIMLFFGKYGCVPGTIGLIISCTFSGILIYKTMEFARKKQIITYEDMLAKLFKNMFWRKTINIIITTFLGICFIVMSAGFGAYFAQEFNLPNIVGCAILCLFCIITLRNKAGGLIQANEVCIPILILLIIIARFAIKAPNVYETCEVNYLKCLLNSALYASYNSITLIPVLIGLANIIQNKKQNIYISIFCSLLLILLGIIILTLTNGVSKASEEQIPMLAILQNVGGFFPFFYGIIILFAMYTSAISCGYGFIQNTSSLGNDNMKLFILCGISIITSEIGFSKMINILYPIFGYLGIIQMFFIFMA